MTSFFVTSMKFISGKKMSMTQIWSGDHVWGVTPVQAGPCTVTQVRIKDKDGYTALQLAYGVRKEKNINKPQLGHYQKTGVKPTFVKEFRVDDVSSFKEGDVVSAGTFSAGDIVSVTGTSKGRGFQGVVKRHHFAGGRKTHGNKDQERMPGSIGPKGPAHVFKGTRMGGRMGGERVTVSNLEVISVDEENNIIYLKGAVPGAIHSFVTIKGKGDLKVNIAPEPKEEVAPVAEEAPAEEATTETVTEVKEETKEEKKEETANEEIKEAAAPAPEKPVEKAE